MTETLKWIVQQEITKRTMNAELATYKLLNKEFNKDMEERFLNNKDKIEDWKDAILHKEKLRDRLRLLTDNETYTRNNLLDIAIISMILSNIIEF